MNEEAKGNKPKRTSYCVNNKAEKAEEGNKYNKDYIDNKLGGETKQTYIIYPLYPDDNKLCLELMIVMEGNEMEANNTKNHIISSGLKCVMLPSKSFNSFDSFHSYWISSIAQPIINNIINKAGNNIPSIPIKP